MAKRRMFSLEIVDSDAFCEMPLSAQALYFHLGMRADDDGVVNSPRKIQKSLGASDDDMRLLIAKRFVLVLDDTGLIVIKHWKINNYIQKDRYEPSKYQEELAILGLDENRAYVIENKPCIQNVSVGKDSIGKVSIDKNRLENKNNNFAHAIINEINKLGICDCENIVLNYLEKGGDPTRLGKFITLAKEDSTINLEEYLYGSNR